MHRTSENLEFITTMLKCSKKTSNISFWICRMNMTSAARTWGTPEKCWGRGGRGTSWLYLEKRRKGQQSHTSEYEQMNCKRRWNMSWSCTSLSSEPWAHHCTIILWHPRASQHLEEWVQVLRQKLRSCEGGPGSENWDKSRLGDRRADGVAGTWSRKAESFSKLSRFEQSICLQIEECKKP